MITSQCHNQRTALYCSQIIQTTKINVQQQCQRVGIKLKYQGTDQSSAIYISEHSRKSNINLKRQRAGNKVKYQDTDHRSALYCS